MENTELLQKIGELTAQVEELKKQKVNAELPTIAETCKVSTKVPPFHTNKPDLWFIQIEAQFRNNCIKADQSKYDIVVAALEPQYLDVVVDIIRNPPPIEKYEAVKNRLIHEYAESNEKKLKILLQGIDLGDNKPSTLLRKMKDLAGSSMSDDIIESLWLSKLPETTRSIVSSLDVNLIKMAAAADKISEITTFETASTTARKDEGNNQNTLEEKVCELTKKVEILATTFERSRSLSRSRSQVRTRSPSQKKIIHDLCWYHYKFNQYARKCEEGCKFNTKNQKN